MTTQDVLSSLSPMSRQWLRQVKDDPQFEGVVHRGKFKRDEELGTRVEPRSLASSDGIYRNAITGQPPDCQEDRT
jgi:hypothetical protein